MTVHYRGRTRINVRAPEPIGQCDRCNFVYMLSDLRPQVEWAGLNLITLNLLVCEECYDEPSVAFRAVIVPPDPLPVLNARPVNRGGMTDYRVTMDDDRRVTEADEPRVLIDNPDVGNPSQ